MIFTNWKFNVVGIPYGTLNALVSTSTFDVSDSPGYIELLVDDVTAKDFFIKNPDLMEITFSHLKNDNKGDRWSFN